MGSVNTTYNASITSSSVGSVDERRRVRLRTSPSSKSLVATPPTPRAIDLANVVVSPPRAIAPCARSHAVSAATAMAGSTLGGDADDVEGARRRRRSVVVNRRFVSSRPARASSRRDADARARETVTHRDIDRRAGRDATRRARRCATTADSMTTGISSSSTARQSVARGASSARLARASPTEE